MVVSITPLAFYMRGELVITPLKPAPLITEAVEIL